MMNFEIRVSSPTTSDAMMPASPARANAEVAGDQPAAFAITTTEPFESRRGEQVPQAELGRQRCTLKLRLFEILTAFLSSSATWSTACCDVRAPAAWRPAPLRWRPEPGPAHRDLLPVRGPSPDTRPGRLRTPRSATAPASWLYSAAQLRPDGRVILLAPLVLRCGCRGSRRGCRRRRGFCCRPGFEYHKSEYYLDLEKHRSKGHKQGAISVSSVLPFRCRPRPGSSRRVIRQQ